MASHNGSGIFARRMKPKRVRPFAGARVHVLAKRFLNSPVQEFKFSTTGEYKKWFLQNLGNYYYMSATMIRDVQGLSA